MCHTYNTDTLGVTSNLHYHIANLSWVRVYVLFLSWWPPATMWSDALIFISTTTRDVWIILSFLIWGYVLHVGHSSCIITDCGQHLGVIPIAPYHQYQQCGLGFIVLDRMHMTKWPLLQTTQESYFKNNLVVHGVMHKFALVWCKTCHLSSLRCLYLDINAQPIYVSLLMCIYIYVKNISLSPYLISCEV